MALKGILVDVNYCTGCEACVLACQQEKGYDETAFGIKVEKFGPWHIEEDKKHWQYDFVPYFTEWCDLCEERCSKGKTPSCVQHCQAQCLEFGEIAALTAKCDGYRKVLVPIKDM